MRPARPRRWNMGGSRLRSEFAPEDLMRGIERDRARFVSEVRLDLSSWRIARLLAVTLRGHPGEGLRGVFLPQEGEHGRVYWWPAHLASHHQGRLLLGVVADRGVDDVLEVEANLHQDGTIYFQFGHHRYDIADHRPAFLSHPAHAGLVDGCLASRGRLIRIDRHGQVRLGSGEIETHDGIAEARHALWVALADEAAAWARSRRATIPDGRPMPDRRSLATFRLWAEDQIGWWSHHPLPTITFEGDAIVATWRGRDLLAVLTFRGSEVAFRKVSGGVFEETPPATVTTRRMVARKIPTL